MGEPFSERIMWYTISLRRALRGFLLSPGAGVLGRKVEMCCWATPAGVREDIIKDDCAAGTALFMDAMEGVRAGSKREEVVALFARPPSPLLGDFVSASPLLLSARDMLLLLLPLALLMPLVSTVPG